MEKYISIIDKFLPLNADFSSEELAFCLFNIRYISEEFLYYPENIAKKLFKDASPGELIYYPFDVLELRKVLTKDFVTPKFFFSFLFAKNHFLDNSLLVGFKAEHNQYGSLCLAKDLTIEPKRIYVREEAFKNGIYDKVMKIIEEENCKIDVNNLFDVPILKPVKKAQVFNAAKLEAPLELTEKEKQIFDYLKQAKSKSPRTKDLQLRVCGGFVRDKLLGLSSDDIDISVPGMTGQEFLNEVGLGDAAHIIEKNPEKSKQLETAKAKILGQEVDFVNLRTEVYKPGSRIPEMTITNDPREDARRRDLTINSIFYNIDTGKVEDYVGGIEDLKTMTLRTPLDPIKTFVDDPLRTLRVLRFYSRFPNSKIDPAIIEAFKDPRVQKAYETLAPSRASKELKKMLAGSKPIEATKILLETGLYKKVFKIPENWHDITIDQQSPYHNLPLLDHTLSDMNNFKDIADQMGLPKEQQSLMMLSALLHDFAKMDPAIRQQKVDKEGKPITFDREGKSVEHMRYVGHDISSAEFANNVMTEMAFEPDEKKFVKTLIFEHMTPHDLVEKAGPKAIGRFLNVTGDLYRHVMGHGQADALAKYDLSLEEKSRIAKQYQDKLKEIEQYKEDVGKNIFTPLIDGNRLKQIVREIDPELVDKNASIVVKGYGSKPVHFMSYLLDALKEKQWKRKINDVQQAEQWFPIAIKQFGTVWRNQNKMKKADASSASITGEFDTIEGQRPQEKVQQGIVYMKRTIPSQFLEGNLVRYDVKGSTGEQMVGRIISKKDNSIIVEWISGKFTGKRQAFDMDDVVRVSKLTILE